MPRKSRAFAFKPFSCIQRKETTRNTNELHRPLGILHGRTTDSKRMRNLSMSATDCSALATDKKHDTASTGRRHGRRARFGNIDCLKDGLPEITPYSVANSTFDYQTNSNRKDRSSSEWQLISAPQVILLVEASSSCSQRGPDYATTHPMTFCQLANIPAKP